MSQDSAYLKAAPGAHRAVAYSPYSSGTARPGILPAQGKIQGNSLGWPLQATGKAPGASKAFAVPRESAGKEVTVRGLKPFQLRENNAGLPLLKAGASSYATVQRLKILSNPDKDEDAKEFFRLRYQQNDERSGVHNYAFLNEEPEKWAKSSGSAHAETQLTGLYAKDGRNMYIVSELRPCPPCREFLPKVEAQRGMKITVYYNLPHEEKSGSTNKAAIVGMYQDYGWLTQSRSRVVQVTSKGLAIASVNDSSSSEAVSEDEHSSD